jgi:predicted ATPase
MPVDKGYFPIKQEGKQRSEHVSNNFRFSHDKIRDFIYSMIEPENCKAIHFKVGEYLLENTPIKKQQLIIFEIVNQLNLGFDFVSLMQKESNWLS